LGRSWSARWRGLSLRWLFKSVRLVSRVVRVSCRLALACYQASSSDDSGIAGRLSFVPCWNPWSFLRPPPSAPCPASDASRRFKPLAIPHSSGMPSLSASFGMNTCTHHEPCTPSFRTWIKALTRARVTTRPSISIPAIFGLLENQKVPLEASLTSRTVPSGRPANARH